MLGFGTLARSVFGTSNDKIIKKFQPKVAAINALEDEMKALSDEELKGKTAQFREQLENGTKLDDLLVPAFAVVREAADRAIGLRHYDVQLLGGMVLNYGSIAEMRTGEGKTLVATLATYLNALPGKGAHVITVNDYLAQRDAAWMGKVYAQLGMSTGVIVNALSDEERQAAYQCDITYGTNNEFGFDYLRDNMKYHREAMAQRGFHFAIVDEVDSILIDEARTPLIISGPLEDKTDLYTTIDQFIPRLSDSAFELDEKQKSVVFTEEGNEELENLLAEADLLKGESLYDVENVSIVHHVNSALRAYKLFERDQHYIVQNDEVVIIDEFTGRQMPGRRYSEGLHQAIEAKEKVAIQPENQTLASITFQNYFRMYDKLAGMTGTAMTEAAEFSDIYGLSVVDVPTHRQVQRADESDEVYRTIEEKYRAIVEEIVTAHKNDQPILVGTTSIDKSELLAQMLTQEGVKDFKILNARYHEQEAFIVAQAGVPGAITIATNMAGRGTDIQLGGNADMRIANELGDMAEGAKREKAEAKIHAEIAELKQKALDAGGLYVIASERHESRRIDNQLRGRAGRQGDPGRSKFFLSIQDDLMRIFGSDRMDGMLQKLGLEEGEAIIHPWINKALERAQQKVEARNFDMRKNLLKFDDVMNDQRKAIFDQRLELMDGKDLEETVKDMRDEVIEDIVAKNIPENAYAEQWDVESLSREAEMALNRVMDVKEWAAEEGIAENEIVDRLISQGDAMQSEKIEQFGEETWHAVQKSVMLQSLDQLWREHLVNLEALRSVIGLRGYAQRDPLNEYKAESFELFQTLLTDLRKAVTTQLSMATLVTAPSAPQMPDDLSVERGGFDDLASGEGVVTEAAPGDIYGKAIGKVKGEADPNDPSTWGNVGRNEPCPCGSGKKYKHCHGKI